MDVPRRGRRYPRLRAAFVLVAPAAASVVVLTAALSSALRAALGDDRPAPAAGAAAAVIEPAGRADACTAAPPLAPARTVLVVIPEVYELANVALTLTSYAEREQHTAWRRGAYYAAFAEHFGGFRDHPLIQRLNAELDGPDAMLRYYAFRESSAAYAFGEAGLIRATPRRYWPEDRFGALLPELEDFAEATGFRDFYAAHRSVYAAQVERYQRLVPVRSMWDWLEQHFPQRYQQYRVVFSPLIKGSHSTRRFEDAGETVMFIGGPDIADDAGAALAPIELARVVFTEIDHNYVNPTTDRHRHRVDAVFADVAAWNEDASGFYATPYATFNEYMTWALFSLYIRDTQPRALPDAAAALERVMARRGFPRFAEFNRALLRLAAGPADCVPDLFPLILEWAEQAQ